MSLSPNVTPFVPKQRSVTSSKQANVSQSSSSWKLTADVAEFVPSWFHNKPESSKDHTQTSSDATATKSSKISATVTPRTTGKNGKNEKVVDKNECNTTPTKPKRKANPSSFKTSNVTNAGKNNDFKQEPDYHENNIASDFPALGTANEQFKTSPSVWNKPLGMSFSDKLKSNNNSSYFYNEPPRLFKDKPKEQQKTLESMTSKAHEDMKKETVNKNKVNTKSVDTITKSDHEGFSVVRSKTKKMCGTVESNDKEDGSFRQEKRPVAWSEVRSDEQTNLKSKVVKKFSENRSKTSRERSGPMRDTHGEDVAKNRSSKDWRSGGNVANDKKGMIREPRKDWDDNIPKDGGSTSTRTRHSFKAARDSYTFRSTHRVSDLEKKCSVRLDNHDNRSSPRTPVNISTVVTRPPLSYSDILKSKPNTQLLVPEKVDENERGVLRIPSEASEEEEMDVQEVEEQEGKSKKKKKKKKKKKSGVEAQPQTVKKSQEALTLDFGDMLAKIMESSSSKRKPVIRTGGFLPAQAPLPPKETRISKKPDTQVANVLDSTAPIVFRSKEREFPKKKKPSAMRKILMKEREDKKMVREGKSPTEPQSSDDEKSDKESSDEQHQDSDDIDPAEVKKTIHSRKFREYCDHDLDYDINGVVIKLLKELIRFQDRLYHKDPIKAKARRRFVCGLREVYKHAKLKKLKCVIVTPNLEPTKSKGGLDDLLSNIIDVCHSQNVPVIFSLNRQVLGRVLLKKVPVSIVGIFYYDGAQDYFKSLMILTEVARETYRDKFNKAREKFLLEKQMATDLGHVETGLESSEMEEDEDRAIIDNDVKKNETNSETRATYEDNFGNEEMRMTRDLGKIEVLRSPDIQNNDDHTVTENDLKNVEANIETRATYEDIFADDKKQMALDLEQTEEALQLIEIQKDENHTITKNDVTNVEENIERRRTITNEASSFGDLKYEKFLIIDDDNGVIENIPSDEMTGELDCSVDKG